MNAISYFQVWSSAHLFHFICVGFFLSSLGSSYLPNHAIGWLITLITNRFECVWSLATGVRCSRDRLWIHHKPDQEWTGLVKLGYNIYVRCLVEATSNESRHNYFNKEGNKSNNPRVRIPCWMSSAFILKPTNQIMLGPRAALSFHFTSCLSVHVVLL